MNDYTKQVIAILLSIITIDVHCLTVIIKNSDPYDDPNARDVSVLPNWTNAPQTWSPMPPGSTRSFFTGIHHLKGVYIYDHTEKKTWYINIEEQKTLRGDGTATINLFKVKTFEQGVNVTGYQSKLLKKATYFDLHIKNIKHITNWHPNIKEPSPLDPNVVMSTFIVDATKKTLTEHVRTIIENMSLGHKIATAFDPSLDKAKAAKALEILKNTRKQLQELAKINKYDLNEPLFKNFIKQINDLLNNS